MKPVTYWARGERSIGGVLPLIILDQLRRGRASQYGSLTKRVGTDRENFPHLPHPPVVHRPPAFQQSTNSASWGFEVGRRLLYRLTSMASR